MKRRVELLIYRPLGFKQVDYEGAADAIESAWTIASLAPFEGLTPIYFGFRWESNVAVKLGENPCTRLWNGIAKRLAQRDFFNIDGAPLQPGEMSLIPTREKYFRGWMVFERK